MRLPVSMWKKTLTTLGLKVVARSPKSGPARRTRRFETLESRQMLSGTPPEVTGVYVSGSGWTDSSPTENFDGYLASHGLGNATTPSLGYALQTGGSQLTTLPWANINEISVQFNQAVTVGTALANAELIGSPSKVAPPSLSTATYSFDSTTNTATWLLTSPLPNNKYVLYIPSAAVVNSSGQQLDGEFTTGSSSFPSGDGTAGGDFAFSFNVLPGAGNQGGQVNSADTAEAKDLNNDHETTTGYSPYFDYDGAGVITSIDASIDASDVNSKLPSIAPAAPSIPGVSLLQGSGTYTANLSPYFSGDFPTGDTVTYTVGGEPSGVTGSFSGSALSLGITNSFTGTANLTIQASDPSGRVISSPLAVAVTPLVGISGATTLNEGSSYTLDLTQASGADLSSWTVNWGDGNTTTLAGGATSATHVYAGGPFATAPTYSITASGTNSSDTFAATTPLAVTVNPPPEVTGVFVGSTSWNSSFLSYLAANNLGSSTLGYQLPTGYSQLATLPWNNINTISVTFNQNVTIDEATQYLELIGATTGTTALSTASPVYNSSTYTVTWTLPSVLTDDQYLLSIPSTAATNSGGQQLDGEFSNANASSPSSTLPSGDGMQGGNFAFQFNVLPGNASQSGTVGSSDINASLLGLSTTDSGYSPYCDIDGSGTIDSTDEGVSTALAGDTLPLAAPTGPSYAGQASVTGFSTDPTHTQWVVNYTTGSTPPPDGFTVAVYASPTNGSSLGTLLTSYLVGPTAANTSASITLAPQFTDALQNYTLNAVIIAPDQTQEGWPVAFTGGFYQDSDGNIEAQSGGPAANLQLSQSGGTLQVSYAGDDSPDDAASFAADSVAGIHVRLNEGESTVTADSSVTENMTVFNGGTNYGATITTGSGVNELVADTGGAATFVNDGGTNTYAFDQNSAGSYAIDDSGGTGTLDFSRFLSGITLNIGETGNQAVSSSYSNPLALDLSSATGIQDVIGSEFADTITTNTLDDTLVGDGGTPLGVTESSSSTGGSVSASVTDVVGDTYVFADTSTPVSDTIIDSSGTATLDFSQIGGGGVTVDLGSTDEQTVNSLLSLTLSSPSGIQNVSGTAGNDTIIGNSRNNTLNGNGGTDVVDGGVGNNTLEGTVGGTFLNGTGQNTINYEDSSGSQISTTVAANGLYSDIATTSDIGEGGVTATGDWATTDAAGFNGSYLSVTPPSSGAGSDSLNWSFGNLGGGTYQIYVSYPASSANTTAAQFTVLDGSTAVADQPAAVDEQDAPSDLTIGDTAFASLGTFEIDSGTLNLGLSDLGLTSGNLAADAVYVVQTGVSSQAPQSLVFNATQATTTNAYTFTDIVSSNTMAVNFYLDVNANGIVDSSDQLITTVTPDMNGNASAVIQLPSWATPANVFAVAVNSGASGGGVVVAAAISPGNLPQPAAEGSEPSGIEPDLSPPPPPPPPGGYETFVPWTINPMQVVANSAGQSEAYPPAVPVGGVADLPPGTGGQSVAFGTGTAGAAQACITGASASGASASGSTQATVLGEVQPSENAEPLDLALSSFSQGLANATASAASGSSQAILIARSQAFGGGGTWTIGSMPAPAPYGRQVQLPVGTPVELQFQVVFSGGGYAVATQSNPANSVSGGGVFGFGVVSIDNLAFQYSGSIETSSNDNSSTGTFGFTANVNFVSFIGAQVNVGFQTSFTIDANAGAGGAYASAYAGGQFLVYTNAFVTAIVPPPSLGF